MEIRNAILLMPIYSIGQETSKEIKAEVETFVTDTSSQNYWTIIYETGQ